MGGSTHGSGSALAAVSQGITTIEAGQDGSQQYPLAEFFAGLETSPVAINVASYAGHGTLRGEVMGDDYSRFATAEELAEMAELLRAEMEAGALGLFADLVLFGPKTVSDRATPEAPHLPSDGIEKVWVNGQLVFDGGQMTGNRPGQSIRRATFSGPRPAVAGR